jgi:restriction system protein
MNEDTVVTGARRAQFAKGILVLLAEAPDGLGANQIVSALESQLPPTDYEQHRYASGPSRFETHIRFTSVKLAKADMLRKAKGKWFITDEGIAVKAKSADDLYAIVRQRYAVWRSQNASNEAESASSTTAEPAPTAQDDIGINLEKAVETAKDEIREAILAIGAYDFQDLVAALLRGMGYQTPFVAPPGPDGGTDILAYLDPLGAQTPHIRVQVKHRGQNKASNSEIASLLGNLNPQREIGLFVSTAGFTPEARRQMQRGQTHMELVDLDRFIELWVAHYGELQDEDKRRLPLQPVYFLAPSVS